MNINLCPTKPYRQENNIGRFHGVLCRDNYPAVVDATLHKVNVMNFLIARADLKVRVLGSPDCKVPLEQVVLQRGGEVLAGGRGHLRRLPH